MRAAAQIKLQHCFNVSSLSVFINDHQGHHSNTQFLACVHFVVAAWDGLSITHCKRMRFQLHIAE